MCLRFGHAWSIYAKQPARASLTLHFMHYFLEQRHVGEHRIDRFLLHPVKGHTARVVRRRYDHFTLEPGRTDGSNLT